MKAFNKFTHTPCPQGWQALFILCSKAMSETCEECLLWCVFCNNCLCLWTLCHSGIGRATALALARCGAKVVAVTRTQADLNSLVEEVHTHTNNLWHILGVHIPDFWSLSLFSVSHCSPIYCHCHLHHTPFFIFLYHLLILLFIIISGWFDHVL